MYDVSKELQTYLNPYRFQFNVKERPHYKRGYSKYSTFWLNLDGPFTPHVYKSIVDKIMDTLTEKYSIMYMYTELAPPTLYNDQIERGRFIWYVRRF